MKKCVECKIEKPLTEFYTSSYIYKTLRPQCKACTNVAKVKARKERRTYISKKDRGAA